MRSFNRNDELVHPYLSARLKLQGRWWRISTKQEFADLLAALETPSVGRPRTPESALNLLHKEVSPLLEEIVIRIQRTHPGKDLEVAIAEILKGIPRITDLQVRRGRQDVIGADITFDYDRGLPIEGLRTTGRCAVQVKSYEGEMSYKRAIEDINKAFQSDPSFTDGLIVSTAFRMTSDFETALGELFKKWSKPVHVLLGKDLARFFIRYGARESSE